MIRSPYPWFGGKSRAASLIWERFGNPSVYIEPFAGSLSVLLSRPEGTWERETINDLDCSIVNFWRAIRSDPEQVAWHCDLPKMEAEVYARHQYLLAHLETLRDRIEQDPEYFDPKIAGYWVYGICAWLGSGWMERASRQQPLIQNNGIFRKFGGSALKDEQTPYQDHYEWFRALADRISRVRVLNGDWRRALSPGNMNVSAGVRDPIIAILLDPPYPVGNMQYGAGHDPTVWFQAMRWARDHSFYRIALCGYAEFVGPHDLPEWIETPWVVKGGFGNRTNTLSDNSKRERIWFSPACLRPDQQSLFG